MSELDTIQFALSRAARRRRWLRAWNGLWYGLLVGAGVWLAALAAYKLAPISISILPIAGTIAGISLLTGFFYGWLRKDTLQQTARWVDGHENLQERLSTALEVAASGKDEGWRTLVVADAARFAQQLEPRKLLPWGLPRISRWALLIVALSAGLGFVPEYRSKEFLEKKRDAQAIKEAGQKIIEVTRQNLDRRPTILEPTRKALESAEQTGLQLSRNPVTRTEALKDLASAADKLKADLSALKNPAVKSLEQAARQTARSSGTGADGDLQKKIDALQKSLGKAANMEALDQLKSDLQKAQKAAAGIPNNDSPEAAAARQQVAQALSDVAKKAQDLGQQIPSLDEAIAALQANQTDNFVRDLDAATTDLEKLKQMTQSLEQLQQQTKEGKDLPEQLKYGQADAAQHTLQKMIDELKSGKQTPEQLKKLVDELSKSVDPASPYGKAAADLKQAVDQLQKGQKPDAAQSLADASKELQKALDQMQDAQAVMASLEAVQKAETAIATRLNWGQCPICGDKTGTCIHAGHNPHPGKGAGGGVGTWTDENSTLYPEMTELTDNSGVHRPDMDPRGQTDRGDAQLADNLAPTKLRGKVTPGGPMPSISLKGVSIKGQSSVQYQESATAAQSAAQSALNQDQVPRAYQNAVRDYFDDLKK